MGNRARQEDKVGSESIESQFDRVPLDHPQDEPSMKDVGSTSGSGRTGGGLGVSRGDYTDVPEKIDPTEDR